MIIDGEPSEHVSILEFKIRIYSGFVSPKEFPTDVTFA